MKFFKTFETYNNLTVEELLLMWQDLDLDDLVFYTKTILFLKDFFKDFKVVRDNDTVSNYAFSFTNVMPVTAEINDRHIGEHWNFIIGHYVDDDAIEISCTNTGDDCNEIDDLNDLIEYTYGYYNLNDIWKTLIQADAIYKTYCPVEVLKELGFQQMHDMKKIGVLENYK